jgi:hypothetical protein
MRLLFQTEKLRDNQAAIWLSKTRALLTSYLHAILDVHDFLSHGVFQLEDLFVGWICHPQLFQLRQTLRQIVKQFFVDQVFGHVVAPPRVFFTFRQERNLALYQQEPPGNVIAERLPL